MPRGVHLGGTILMSSMSIKQDDKVVASTDLGYGFAGRVGKDFWLSDHQALGIVGQFAFAVMPDKASSSATESPTVTATSFTLAASATFNQSC